MMMSQIGVGEKLTIDSLEPLEVKLVAAPDSGGFEEYHPEADIYQNRVRKSDKGILVLNYEKR